jgi:hypothetical protein
MKKIAVLFVLILAFCGCENSSGPSLEERFSCKVDGKLFVAAEDSKNAISGSRKLTIEYYGATAFSPYYLVIIGRNSNDENVSVGCGPVTKADTSYTIVSAAYSTKSQRYDSNPIGIVTISKLDTINKTITGNFSFTIKKSGSEVINITEGKFNSSYIPRN